MQGSAVNAHGRVSFFDAHAYILSVTKKFFEKILKKVLTFAGFHV